MKFKKGDIVRYKDYLERVKFKVKGEYHYINYTKFKLMCDTDSSSIFNIGYLLNDNYELIEENFEFFNQLDDNLKEIGKYMSKTLSDSEMELDVDYYRRLKLEKIKSKFYE